MKDITIVTAFFDINRANMDGFNRSNQKYIDAFKFWARIKNKMIIFSDKNTIEEVKKIRNEYGLLDKTETIIIADYLKETEPDNTSVKRKLRRLKCTSAILGLLLIVSIIF